MREIEAINYCVRKSSREPLADISELSEQSANAKATLVRVRQEILETGFRFNSRTVTLQASTAGRVPITLKYLDLVLPMHLIAQVDDVDGKRYVWNEATQDWHDQQTDAKVVYDIPTFEHLPHKFAVWIARQAAVEYWSETHGGKSAPNQLIHEALQGRQRALNSEPPVDIRDRTGWRGRLLRFERGTVSSRQIPPGV